MEKKGSLAPLVIQDLLIHVTVAAAEADSRVTIKQIIYKKKKTNVKPNEKRHKTKQVI